MNVAQGISKKCAHRALIALKQAECVFFDVDSTIIHQEGLDELAHYLGKRKEIEELTNIAMGGRMSYVEAFEKRMALLSPTQEDFNSFLKNWNPTLTDGVKEFIQLLKNESKQVILVSGGIYELILPVYELLGLSPQYLFCNRILFKNGRYSDFERESLINQPQGKCLIIQQFMKNHNIKHAVMIGDGSTDLETSSVVDCFIGYGGVHERPIVKRNASFFTSSFVSLLTMYSSYQV